MSYRCLSSIEGTSGISLRRKGVVVSVASGGVAANAGLKPMDVILEVSGQKVSQPDDVLAITGKMRAGYQASLTVWHNLVAEPPGVV